MIVSNGTLGLGLFILLLALGIVLHKWNMMRIYKNIMSTRKTTSTSGNDNGQISKEDLYNELFTRQGSNFSAAAVSAWMLLFVAFACYYFLTPGIFQKYNYFGVANLASSPVGFFVFGVLVILLTCIVAVWLPKLYSYYEISKNMKIAIMLTVPVLMASVVLSAYQGTIYPHNDSGLMAIAFVALFGSQIALFLPIFTYTVEAIR
ncbi:MAG: hypothetical protein ACXQT4_03265 [Methanotrichaceae archaeon]